MNPKGWNLEKLKEWLSRPLTQEDDHFDLKEKIPDDNDGKCRLKKEFCSFANASGGFFFFGIDRDKNVVGVNESDDEFTTKLSQIVTAHIFPPTIHWELYEHISLEEDSKCVFIVKVFESVYWRKPHVFYKQEEGLCIPLREHGHMRPITDGAELRRIILKIDSYYPEYNIHVVDIMKQIKSKSLPDFSLIEASIIQGFKSHLRSNPDEQAGRIVNAIEEIERRVADLKKSFLVGVVEGGVTSTETDKQDLERIVDNFLSNIGNKLI